MIHLRKSEHENEIRSRKISLRFMSFEYCRESSDDRPIQNASNKKLYYCEYDSRSFSATYFTYLRSFFVLQAFNRYKSSVSDVKLYIHGKSVASQAIEWIDVHNPATNEVCSILSSRTIFRTFQYLMNIFSGCL